MRILSILSFFHVLTLACLVQAAPVRYFEFSSNTQVSPARIKQIVAKYGTNVMIGGDTSHENFWSTMKAATAFGVKKHAYLEGPGGTTGDSGIAADEMARMKAGAKSVGIDVRKRTWLKAWYAWGWLAYTRNQIKFYHSHGFSSVEIDNLYVTLGESSATLVRFFQDHQKWMVENKIPTTIMLKNISPGQFKAINAAIQANALSRNVFSDFHISELGTGNRAQQHALSAKIGIQTLNSNNTYSYSARGEYRVPPQN